MSAAVPVVVIVLKIVLRGSQLLINGSRTQLDDTYDGWTCRLGVSRNPSLVIEVPVIRAAVTVVLRQTVKQAS
jgi:hypothetical protein